MWNLEMRLVHELLFITRELTAEGMEDKRKKVKNGDRMSTFIKVYYLIPSPSRDFPNVKPDHLFLCLSLPIVAE